MKLLRNLLLAIALALPLLSGASWAQHATVAQSFARVPLDSIATPGQIKWLAMHYARSGYQAPTTMEDSPWARGNLTSLVHPSGEVNQPRDVWSESMQRIFGKPVRVAVILERRSLEQVIAEAVYLIQDGRRPRELTNRDINHLNKHHRGWTSIYHQALAEAWAKYERERARG